MHKRSFYRQGIEQYLLRSGKFSKEYIESLSDEELDELHSAYLKENNIDEKAHDNEMRDWYFTNR